MIKRLTSLALILCLMLTMIPAFSVFAGVSEDMASQTEIEELFKSLGIIDGTYSASAEITRAEFATVIAKTAKLIDTDSTDEWKEENFGDAPVGTVIPEVSAFSDVDPANEHYKAIVAVGTAGYMNGVGEGLFAPDHKLVTSEAVKVVVDMLGYNSFASSNGGYPKGYLATANRLKLLSGVGSNFNNLITQEDIITILYNAMDVAVSEFDGIEEGFAVTKPGEVSFMRDVMKIDKVEGQITDNGITALKSASKISPKYMMVGETKLLYTPASEKFRSLIGREVTAYYDVSNEAYPKLIHVIADDEATVIDAKDFVSYSSGTIKYYTGTKTKSINVGRKASMIYNGAYVKTYSASDFDIEDGSITVIESDNGNVIVVEDYKNVLVSMVSKENGSVYNKLSFAPLGEEIKIINLLDDEDFVVVDIYSEDGKALDIADISVNDVLSIMKSKNGEYAKAIVCSDVLSATTIYSFDGEKYEIDGGEIEAAEAFTKATNKENIDYNNAYDIHLNAFGKMVWAASAGAKANEKVAILLKLGGNSASGFDDVHAVRTYTEDGKITDFVLNDKITLNGERVKAEDSLTELNANIARPVLYTSKDGVITSITTPAPYGTDASDDKRGWYKVTHDIEFYEKGNMTDSEWNSYVWSHYYIYSNAGNGAAYTIRTDGSQTGPRASILTHSDATKFYSVPTSPDDFDTDKYFSLVTKPSFPENSYFAIEGYSRIAKNPCPEVMVQRKNAKGSGTPGESSAFLVTKVKTGLNSDEEEVTILEGYDLKQNSAKKVSLKVNVDAIMLDEDNSEIDTTKSAEEVGPRTYKELEAGDMLRYSTNAMGEVNTMRISFDYDNGKSYDRDGGYHTASYGAVMSVTANAMKVVTGDIAPEDFDYSKIEHVASTRVYPLTATSVVFIAERSPRGELTFRQATASDIVTYESTLVPGEYDMAATVAHWFGGFLATVIYR